MVVPSPSAVRSTVNLFPLSTMMVSFSVNLHMHNAVTLILVQGSMDLPQTVIEVGNDS